MVQFRQRRDRNSRRADFHTPTGDRIEHPSGHDDHEARRYLDVDDVATSSAFNVMPPQPPTVQGMPAIMNNDILPDMGRMTPTLP
jgi:hypothetical protein